MGDYLADTRRSYDAMAEDYAVWIAGELAHKPFDRAALEVFATLLPAGPVLDVGCGTGRITAFLAALGVPVSGLDLSPGMVEVARREHPALTFGQGSMTSLAAPDGSLAGVVAWYSTIHVPDEDLPGVFAEFRRVLAPGGLLQLAFQVGTHVRHRADALGSAGEIALDFHHRAPASVTDLLATAGFEVVAQTWRAPDRTGPYPEDTPQAYVLARR